MSGDELILEELQNQTLLIKELNTNIETSNNLITLLNNNISFILPMLFVFLIFKLFRS